ncbi:MAG TPA: sigma-70 family RNA polymerase sigma factor [Pirellulales bacterium]|nr:sigma-70 family RNA polymerase sigma factor [Pirellulales bacterium]
MTTTPLSLLERLRSNPDEESWARLVSLYDPWLDRVLLHAGVADSDVDDLRQEVLAAVFREMPGFEHNGRAGAFRRWMRSIVVNRVRGYFRARQTTTQRTTEPESWSHIADPIAELEDYWDREHDRYLIAELLKIVEPCFSRSTWRAFQRQVIDGLRASAVAPELGISVNAAMLAKSRVMSRLRAEGRLLLDDV